MLREGGGVLTILGPEAWGHGLLNSASGSGTYFHCITNLECEQARHFRVLLIWYYVSLGHKLRGFSVRGFVREGQASVPEAWVSTLSGMGISDSLLSYLLALSC